MSAQKTRNLLARYNAEVEALKRNSRRYTQKDVNQLLITLMDIVGDLIVIVEEHQHQPFTKAHDKGDTA
jgi:ribosomal protein S24E